MQVAYTEYSKVNDRKSAKFHNQELKVIELTGTLAVSFSQMNIIFGEDAVVHMTDANAPGLTSEIEAGQVRLITARQVGDVPVKVQIHEQRPSLQAEWTEVAEFSATPGLKSYVTGWGIDDEARIELPLLPRISYRIRYAIVDGQLGHDQFDSGDDGPAREGYVVQVWQEIESSPRVIELQSAWSQIWK